MPLLGGQGMHPYFCYGSFKMLHFEGCINYLEVRGGQKLNTNLCNSESMQQLVDHNGNKCTCVWFYVISFILGEVAR